MTGLVYVLSLLCVTGAFAFALREMHRLLEAERVRNRELLDRLFLMRNLPPSGTDMKARDEQRRQSAESRRERPRQPADPTAKAYATLAAEEKRQQGQS